MKRLAALILLLPLGVFAESQAGLAAVAQLGQVNGTALACDRPDLVTKAKALMGARVPKTRTYGEAFEQATDAAYREQTADRANCPVDVILSLRFEAADLKLGEAFPPSAPQ